MAVQFRTLNLSSHHLPPACLPPAGASLDANLPVLADCGWPALASELGLSAADCRRLDQLGETAQTYRPSPSPEPHGTAPCTTPRTALCCAALVGAAGAAAALVDAGAKLNGAFNALCQLACPGQGSRPPPARVEPVVDALLRRGLEPPGENPPAVQLVQENFYGMSGQGNGAEATPGPASSQAPPVRRWRSRTGRGRCWPPPTCPSATPMCATSMKARLCPALLRVASRGPKSGTAASPTCWSACWRCTHQRRRQRPHLRQAPPQRSRQRGRRQPTPTPGWQRRCCLCSWMLGLTSWISRSGGACWTSTLPCPSCRCWPRWPRSCW